MKSWGPNEFYPQDRDEEEAEMYKFSAMVCFVIQGPFGLKCQPPEKGFSFYTSNYFYKKFPNALLAITKYIRNQKSDMAGCNTNTSI